MDALPGPAVGRRKLGMELKRLREEAGLKTIAAASRRSGVSTATISRSESAKQAISRGTVSLLCQAYGVGAPMLDYLLRLTEAAEDRGWTAANSDTVPDWFRQYADEEAEATEIHSWEDGLVPGLMQTEEYCRAVTAASGPDVTEDDIERAVHFRQARQARLESAEPPRIVAVINEAAVRRVVGSPEVMRAQLEHLLVLAERPNIHLRVLPFTAGAHPAMTGSFSMLRFPDDDGMATIYVEVQAGALYPDRPADFERYTWVFQRLTELALSQQASRELLTRVMGEM